jgi:hypothetical protein
LLSVQLFSTWQGTVLYGVLMLLVLYALNLEQRRLAAQGLLALTPVPPLAETMRPGATPVGSDLLLELYPELRPLALARRGQGLAVLRRREPAPTADSATQQQPQMAAASGVLSLQLSRPTRLLLRRADGQRQSLDLGAGELQLPLLAPDELTLEPAPEQVQAVLWNGIPLSPAAPGRYRWPRAAMSP